MLQFDRIVKANRKMLLLSTSLIVAGCGTATHQNSSATAPINSAAMEQSAEELDNSFGTERIMRMAERAWNRGDAQTAVRFYSMASSKDPENPKPILAVAEILRKTKKIDAAKDVYQQLLAKFPKEVEVHNGIGYLYLSQDKPYLATQSFEIALGLQENNSKALGGIALAMDTAGNHEKAHDHYRKAIKAEPNNLTYQNNLALSLALAGRLEQAIAMLEIITAHPNAIAQHRQNLALVYGMAGKSAEAMKYSRIDLSERDARNNALYFQALNETPAEVATAQINDLAETTAKAKESRRQRDPSTSRQPYTPVAARQESTTISTNPLPAASPPTALAAAAQMANLDRGMQVIGDAEVLVAAKSPTTELNTNPAAAPETAKSPLAQLAELINTQRPPAYRSSMADAGEQIAKPAPKTPTQATVIAKTEPMAAAEPVKAPQKIASATANPHAPGPIAEMSADKPAAKAFTQMSPQTVSVNIEDKAPEAVTAAKSPTAPFKLENARIEHLSDVQKPLYYIQLASFQTLDKAKQAWDELTTAHNDLLQTFKPVYTVADLGEDKGTYYRVRIGGFAEKAAPADLCSTLKSRNTDCYLPLVTEQIEIDGEAIAVGDPVHDRVDVATPKEPTSVAAATDVTNVHNQSSGYIAY